MDVVLNDPDEFCRKNQKLEGRIKVAELARLSAVCTTGYGELQWAVEGKISPSGHPRLDLTIRGQVDLTCQRCLETFSFDLDCFTAIMLADSDVQADEIEEMLEDDDPTEVIVKGEKIDILALVEDEVLLTMPLSPRHDICPDTSRLVFGEKRESPFAALQSLKTGERKKN